MTLILLMLLSPLLSGYQSFATLSSALFKKIQCRKKQSEISLGPGSVVGDKGKNGVKRQKNRRAKRADQWAFPSPDSLSAHFIRRFCFSFFPISFPGFPLFLRENPGNKVSFFPELRRMQVQSYHVTNVIQSDRYRMKISCISKVCLPR